MGCFGLLVLCVVVVVLVDQVVPGLAGDELVSAAAWMLAQHGFWAGAIGASAAAVVWVSLGRHLAASAMRRDIQAKAEGEYRRYGGW